MVASVTATPVSGGIGVADSPSRQWPDRLPARADGPEMDSPKVGAAAAPATPAVVTAYAGGFSAALIAQRILPKSPSPEAPARRASGWKAPESSLRLTDRSV